LAWIGHEGCDGILALSVADLKCRGDGISLETCKVDEASSRAERSRERSVVTLEWSLDDIWRPVLCRSGRRGVMRRKIRKFGSLNFRNLQVESSVKVIYAEKLSTDPHRLRIEGQAISLIHILHKVIQSSSFFFSPA